MKNLSKLGFPLSKQEQQEINGGFFGCQPQLIQCNDNSDCPPCSFGCGIPITLPDGSVIIADVCAF